MRNAMRRSLAWITWIGCLAASFATFSPVTRAETFSAADGVQNFGPSICFKWVESSGSMGVQRISGDSCANQSFIMPVYWKTFSTTASTLRTVNVRGRRSSSTATFQCTLFVIDQDGLVKSQASGSLTTTGSYSLLPLTVNNVMNARVSFVSCNISASNATFLNLEYAP
jgi:hypothetical protein